MIELGHINECVVAKWPDPLDSKSLMLPRLNMSHNSGIHLREFVELPSSWPLRVVGEAPLGSADAI